jgi:hypothetical protein
LERELGVLKIYVASGRLMQELRELKVLCESE